MQRLLRVFKGSYLFSYSKAMYEAWKIDPTSVHSDWDIIFKSECGVESKISFAQIEKEKELALTAYLLIRYYKQRGHELAQLDPLKLGNYKEFGKKYVSNSMNHELNRLKELRQNELDDKFTFPNPPIFHKNIAGFLAQKTAWTLREIIHKLESIYSRQIGIQFMHICDPEERCWIMREFEKLADQPTTREDKLRILEYLAKSETFNSFLDKAFPDAKRWGIEGLDTVISGMDCLVQQAAKKGVQEIGIGMSHRGKLNVLSNILNKPFEKIFAEFQQLIDQEQMGSGDLKQCLGVTEDKVINGSRVRLSVLPHPGHLEAVAPICLGHVKAIKDSFGNEQKSLAVILHGDSAISGQGIVYETLQQSQLNAYNVNGTIHIINNNQIGYTTTPSKARSGLYPSNVAKCTQCPIIHVNADEPESVDKVIQFAVDYRMKFKKDIFVDIIGYRRHGHSKIDDPTLTQPLMYKIIAQHKSVYSLYSERLINQGSISKQQLKQLWNKHYKSLEKAYQKTLNQKFDVTKWKSTVLNSLIDYSKLGKLSYTGLNIDIIKKIGERVTHIPDNLNIHPMVKKIYDQRRKSIAREGNIDFATAEAIAFTSLLNQGFNVRFTGQDVERGAFSHRHAIIVDQLNQKKYVPIHNMLDSYEQWRFHIENSLLSENAALGFQYGYSITNPNTLTIWEAQFGDFANGAQMVIDNYITAGESKWQIESGLIVNLPHGMDGQGPDHSSARMERYLQMMNDSWLNIIKNGEFHFDPRALRHTNMSVICCSTADNYFHSLRRQLRRDYRKPLINCFSKKLLKMKDAFAPLVELTKNKFNCVIDDQTPGLDPQTVTKVVLLYGQAYYAVFEKRKKLNCNDVALVRIEQLAPLHYEEIIQVLERYPNAIDFVWFQEEHRNAGAWRYVQPRISIILEVLKKQGKIRSDQLICVARKTSASPAVGKRSKHELQQAQILKHLFEI